MKTYLVIPGSLGLIIALAVGGSAVFRGRNSDDSPDQSVPLTERNQPPTPTTIHGNSETSNMERPKDLEKPGLEKASNKSGEKMTIVNQALVVAADRTLVRAGVSGILKKVTVSEGNTVEAGQIVAELDTGEIDAEIEGQTRVIAGAKKLVDECESALAFAECEQTVHQKLARSQAIAFLDFEGSKAGVRSKTAKLAALKNQILVEKQREEVLLRKRGKHRFLAPFAGTVTEVLCYPNQYVGEGDAILWLESNVKHLHLHAPATFVGKLDQVRFSAFHNGHWLALKIFTLRPRCNPDGSRTMVFRLPPEESFLAGQALEVRVASNGGNSW